MSGGNARWRAGAAADKAAGRMQNYPSDFTACACQTRSYSGVPCANVRDLGQGWRVCEDCGSTWTGDFKRHVLTAFDLRPKMNFEKT